MNFEKYHALGNDYLVYDPNNKDISFSESEIIQDMPSKFWSRFRWYSCWPDKISKS